MIKVDLDDSWWKGVMNEWTDNTVSKGDFATEKITFPICSQKFSLNWRFATTDQHTFCCKLLQPITNYCCISWTIRFDVILLRISHRNIGDIAVKDILPAKVEFVMTLLNNSDNIRHDLDHMMYHMGNMITLKQSVIDSVSAYIEQNRNFIQNLIGREFQFDSFFR